MMLDSRVEVITGRERRRRWSTAVKLRIVAEAVAPEPITKRGQRVG